MRSGRRSQTPTAAEERKRESKMIYYQVVMRVYGNGAIDVSEVKTFEGDRIPESSSAAAAVCYVYYDYFESEEQAEKFRREALREAGRK